MVLCEKVYGAIVIKTPYLRRFRSTVIKGVIKRVIKCVIKLSIKGICGKAADGLID